MKPPRNVWQTVVENFDVFEGNDPSVLFTLYDLNTRGEPVFTDLTGVIVEVVVSPQSGEVVFSSENGEVDIVQATAGLCRVNFTAAAFAAPRSPYKIDVIRDGRRLTYVHGIITKIKA